MYVYTKSRCTITPKVCVRLHQKYVYVYTKGTPFGVNFTLIFTVLRAELFDMLVAAVGYVVNVQQGTIYLLCACKCNSLCLDLNNSWQYVFSYLIIRILMSQIKWKGDDFSVMSGRFHVFLGLTSTKQTG